MTAQLLTTKEVLARIRLSRSALHLAIGRGEFKKPAKFGSRNFFDAAEVEQWIAQRFAARYPPDDPHAPKQELAA